MVNKELIKRKISLIEDELVHLKGFSQYSFEEIISDFKNQAVIERLLERIISRAIDINQHLVVELYKKEILPPKSYKETFIKLAELEVYSKDFADNIAKSVGTRNILIHDCDAVDYSRIYSSVADCLKDYQKYCDYILKFLENIEN